MKKLLTAALALIIVLSFAGCSSATKSFNSAVNDSFYDYNSPSAEA